MEQSKIRVAINNSLKHSEWWDIYVNIDGKKTVLAKVKSKGLAYIVMQRLAEIYGRVGIE